MSGWEFIGGFVVGLGAGIAAATTLFRRGGISGGSERLLHQVHQDLRSMAASFSSPAHRGHWGEHTLVSILEQSGLDEGVSFLLHPKLDSGGAVVVPDVVFLLPHGRKLVVDSKLPDAELMKAESTDDVEQRQKHMRAYVSNFRKAIRDLSDRHYENAPVGSPDIVVMYVPSEAAFRAAVAEAPDILITAAEQRVAIATPATLLAMAAIVKTTWGEYRYAEDTAVVRREERELFLRLDGLVKNLSAVRSGLNGAANAYNRAVHNYTNSVQPQVRRLAQYGLVPQMLGELEPLDTELRQLRESAMEEPASDSSGRDGSE